MQFFKVGKGSCTLNVYVTCDDSKKFALINQVFDQRYADLINQQNKRCHNNTKRK